MPIAALTAIRILAVRGAGRSIRILKWQLGDADVPLAEHTVRDYAAWEAEQDDDIEGWLRLIGDTDVRFDRTGPAEVWRSDVMLDGGTAGRIEAWCRAKGVSPFVFALHVTHHVLRACSHAAFSLGVAYDTRPPECMETVGMFVNTVLVPFGAGVEPIEKVEAPAPVAHRRARGACARARLGGGGVLCYASVCA